MDIAYIDYHIMNISCDKKEQSDPGQIKNDPMMYKLDVIIHQPLRQVDIVAAIGYYGVTELLDTIGGEEIEHYLAGR